MNSRDYFFGERADFYFYLFYAKHLSIICQLKFSKFPNMAFFSLSAAKIYKTKHDYASAINLPKSVILAQLLQAYTVSKSISAAITRVT